MTSKQTATPRTDLAGELLDAVKGVLEFERVNSVIAGPYDRLRVAYNAVVKEANREARAAGSGGLDADLLHRACANLNLVVRMPPEWGGGLYPWPVIVAEYARLQTAESEEG